MNEPTEIRAGFTASWTESLTDYPSGTWDLWYTLSNRDEAFRFQATSEADGTFTATVARTVSAAWAAGEYTLTGYVEDATERHLVYRGALRVRADVSAGDPVDDRSHAERVLDAVKAALEGRATHDQMSVAIGGRSLQRHTIAELHKLRHAYEYEVAVERGERPPVQNIAIRFRGTS